jgi:hypothetical protein
LDIRRPATACAIAQARLRLFVSLERATGIEPAHRGGLPNGFEDHCATVTPRPLCYTIQSYKKTIMSKGISSKNSLKALAHPVQRFITGWGAQERASHSDGTGSTLPAPYELAALRGEGILRERFFQHFMKKLPVELNAGQQISLWNDLVEDGGHVTAWVQRLGIAKALRREAVLPIHMTHESRKLYCLLLDTLANQAIELLPWAVEAYFWHVWRAQFPETTAVTKPNTTQAEVLRNRLVRALRKLHQETVEVKESFREDGEQVKFSLLAKRSTVNRWEELVQMDRPRLKTARLAAYDAALKETINLQSSK